MLASYNSDLGKVEFFKNSRKNVAEMSDEVKELFDVLQSDPTLVNWDSADGFVNFAKDIGIADKTFAKFLETTQKSGTVYKTSEEAIAGYQSYLKTTGKQLDLANFKTKALSLSMKVLSSIGWAALISLATKAIQVGIGAIDKFVNSAKYAKETAEEFASSLNDMHSTQKSNTATIAEISDEYKELSKHVNSLGEITGLTTEETDRYYEICNQVAEIIPSLVQSYDEQGNAILKVRGNLADLNEEYKKYKQNEAIEYYNQEDEDGDRKVESVFDSYNDAFTRRYSMPSYKWKLLGNYYDLHATKAQQIDYLSSLSQLNNEELLELSEKRLKHKESGDYSDYTRESYLANTLRQYGLDEESTEEEIASIRQNIQNDLAKLQTEMDGYLNQISISAITYGQQSDKYWALDTDSQKYFQILLNNLTPELIGSDVTEEGMQNFVNKFIACLEQNKGKINEAFSNLFTFDFDNSTLTPEEINAKVNEYIQQIANSLGIKGAIQLKIALGFEDTDSLINNYNAAIQEGKFKFGEDLTLFFKKNSINTQEEIDKWLEIADSVSTADEAKKKYLSEMGEGHETTSFADAFKTLTEETQSTLKELALSGEISPAVLTSTEDYKQLLKDTGTTAEEACEKIREIALGESTLADVMSQIQSSAQLINDVETEMAENGQISFDTLQKIASQHPSLEQYVRKYLNGVEGAESELIEQLYNYYQADLQNYDSYYEAKQGNDETWWSNYINNAESWVRYNAYLYGIDLKNYKTVFEAKQALEDRLENIKTLKEKAQTDKENAEKSLTTSFLPYSERVKAESTVKISSFVEKNLNEEESEIQKVYEEILRVYEDSIQQSGSMSDNFTITDFTSGSSSSSSSSPQTFDWIEIKIDRLNDALDKIKTKADNTYSSWTKRNTELANAISKTQEAINLQSQAYSKYMQQADSVGLPDTWKKLVENGSLDIEPIADETLKDKINEYQTWYEKAQECAKTQETLNAELNELKSQKFTNIKSEYDAVINRMQSAYDLLENQITLLSSSGDYNSLRDRQNSIISSLQSERNTLQNMLNASGIEEYTESGYNLVSQIDDLDSQISDAQNALKDIDNLQFDNLKESFDFDTSVLEHGIQTIQNKIDLLELKGQFANESYYNGMIEYTQKELDTLKNERTQLQSILNNTLYEQGTSEWNDMYSALMDIDGEIDSMTNNLVDFNNAIRDLNWEIFEYLEESISRITDETDYYVELLSKKHLFDENGQITNYGITSMALHAVAYDVNKQKAQDYYEEIQELQRQLVNGAGKDVLEQYNDMVKAHRNAVLAAEDEKQAILDLIEDGYNQQLEALQRLIDKKKEQLNAEKNLYDYQKNIKEKTDNIASLEKQKLAYEGDTSEEAMSKIQQIKVQLEEAKADLKETEYEQYLQDTETMLDQLSTDYEEWMNARLDNSDVLLTEIVSTVAGKGDEINNTLNEAATEYGTMVSDTITSVFDAASPFTNALTGGLNGVSISISGTTAAINSLVNKISGITGVSANNNLSGTTSGSSDKPSNSTANAYSNNKTAANTNTSGNKATSNSAASNAVKTGKALLDSILINKTDYYPKASLNIDTSLVDRLKYNNKDSSWSARALYWSKIFGGTYTGSASQNTKLLNYLKANGYAKGSKYIPYDQLALLGEEGNELQFDTSQGVLREVGQGDKIFTNEASQKLYDFANNPEAFIQKYSLNTLSKILPQPIPDIKLHNFDYSGRSRSSQNMNVGDININMELPGVENYEDFRNKLIKDNTFENAMFTSINHAITGKGTSLDKLKFIN